MASATPFLPRPSLSPPDPPNPPNSSLPTMPEIMESSRSQGLHLSLRTLGPFFRVRAEAADGGAELGKAEGVIRFWAGGRLLHLDSIRMRRETVAMDRSIFGLGLFLGAVAVRHGFDWGCTRAELLAINDSPLYHSKDGSSWILNVVPERDPQQLKKIFDLDLVRFYTRMGFKAVHEADGSSMGDLAHMLVWGGRGTRMDADIEELLMKWGRRFKPQSGSNCSF